MKKILFITTQFPYPLDNGGKIGAFNGLDSLADNNVYLLAFSEQMNFVDEGCKILCSRWPNLHIVDVVEQDIHIQKKPVILASKILQSYFGKLPYMVVKFQNQKMVANIDKIMSKNTFDVIFIDYLNMQNYGDHIRKNYRDKYKLLILKNHNIEYEIFKQTAAKAGILKKIALTPIWKKTKKYEFKSVKNADAVISVCNDNTYFFNSLNNNVYTMKPSFDIYETDKKMVENHRLLYIGNLSWSANMNGVIWFVNEVLPIVKKRFPDVSLSIVGSGNVNNPFVDNKSVNWIGYVEDLTTIYDGHRVFIVPLFEGSGIRIKILDAFNHEIPVVSTTLACNTIGAKNEQELYIADDKVAFADDIVKLFSDDAVYNSLVKNAKIFLKRFFSVEARRKEMNVLLDKLSK